jgi:hypothetical protein
MLEGVVKASAVGIGDDRDARPGIFARWQTVITRRRSDQLIKRLYVGDPHIRK